MKKAQKSILWFRELSKKDVPIVGGKNASLGEMFSCLSKKGVSVPDGFALTAGAYWHFLKTNKIDKALEQVFKRLNPKSIKSLKDTSLSARNLILAASFPADLEKAIEQYYKKLSQKYAHLRLNPPPACDKGRKEEQDSRLNPPPACDKGRKEEQDSRLNPPPAAGRGRKEEGEVINVAVRSSATAEDSAKASFAGQHETYLNVRGPENLKQAIKKCMASLFTARAIAYREEKGFKHLKIALSVGVQKMVRSETASSGVMFTLDTESGFRDVVLINSIWGVGELIVKGLITPDEFFVFKPTLGLSSPRSRGGGRVRGGREYRPIIVKNLGRKNKKYIYGKAGGLKEAAVPQNQQLKFSLTDDEILRLAKWAVAIEEHYGSPQDIEWAKDGDTGKLFIVQSRPETVHAAKQAAVFEEYQINTTKKPLLTGIAIGGKIGQGRVHIIPNVSKISDFKQGEALVTKMTDPDWLPAMRIASAIVTDEGGKTCHSAIVAREFGIPAVVGAEKATSALKQGEEITVDCSQGLNGRIFEGKVLFSVRKYNLKNLKKPKTKIMLNIAVPEMAFSASKLPNDGVGLAREEFIIAEKIRVHPLALYHYNRLKSGNLPVVIPSEARVIPSQARVILSQQAKNLITKTKLQNIIKQIDEITVEHKDKIEYFVKELAEGVGQIAAAFFPKPVIVRFSDFKTNEYRNLIGGELFEPEDEANPMLGFRGASRYYDADFKPAFLMELEAIKRARDVFGLKNIKLMVPFCRTVEEGKKVLKIMRQAGLASTPRHLPPPKEMGEKVLRHLPSPAGRGESKRGEGLEVYVMAELPSNVELADEFLDIFDGMSIGSNDLAQLTLGMDRDNGRIANIADERNDAVKQMIQKVIKACKKKKKYCGICGQAPSDFPDFADFLIKQGIESISLNPDTVIKTMLQLSK